MGATLDRGTTRPLWNRRAEAGRRMSRGARCGGCCAQVLESCTKSRAADAGFVQRERIVGVGGLVQGIRVEGGWTRETKSMSRGGNWFVEGEWQKQNSHVGSDSATANRACICHQLFVIAICGRRGKPADPS